MPSARAARSAKSITNCTWLGGSTSEASAFGQHLVPSSATTEARGDGVSAISVATTALLTSLTAGLVVVGGAMAWRSRRRRRALLRRY
ncbi:hypothetical protein F9278_12025 [Streptomyces phaeolivaceus]|uniref:Uncharacterized protein n=1 Tax=Streptomyces phaeolivaceus TaxID=2653200 RepID=A0A5P8K2H0_9ACTN|nr:hypothetical protein [Streptomyces phaeolivaceus]QFQ96827.1 hypothetical protein F9278_12025 [Streptomyces phaeolivaceus]